MGGDGSGQTPETIDDLLAAQRAFEADDIEPNERRLRGAVMAAYDAGMTTEQIAGELKSTGADWIGQLADE